MSAGNLSEFIASFSTTELARPNRFEVEIAGAPEYFKFRCETAELPGKSFMTHDQKIYGPTQKFPYQHQYNDMNLTFIVSDDMGEKVFFDNWMNSIASLSSYDFNYKNTYARDVLIRQYSLSDKISLSVKLNQAYPIAINQLDLDWSSDGHHKLVVTFAYNYWE
jgi:hypothetical protein